MASKKGTQKKADAKAKAPRVRKNLDEMVKANPTTGTDYQAYWRACLKAGKVL